VTLPATPKRIHAVLATQEEPAPPETARAKEQQAKVAPRREGREIAGRGSFDMPVSPDEVWRALLDPQSLHAVIPGCRRLDVVGTNTYRAEVSLGVGAVRGRFVAQVRLSDLEQARSGRLSGTLDGPLGAAVGQGLVRLAPTVQGTRIDYDYAVTVSGKVTAIGGRLLDGATQVIMRQFFERLARQAKKASAPVRKGLFARFRRVLSRLFGGQH
jgi:2-furoyl-CoA dehydrogenase large subunit